MMPVEPQLIVIAYSFYPEIKSSEGIVNFNWVEILKERSSRVQLLSVFTTVFRNEFDGDANWTSEICAILKNNYKNAKNPKGLEGLIYRLKNKLSSNIYNVPRYLIEWNKLQLPKLLDILKSTNYTVVWIRVLPEMSLILPFETFKKTDFPLIINCNDPIIENEGAFPFFTTLIPKTQCWTFPSLALRNKIAKRYHLDKERCFVLPHAMQHQKYLYQRNTKNKKIKIVYTGTFYKNAFTNEFQNSLLKFNTSEAAIHVEFTFVLAQYDVESIIWLEESLDNVKIIKKLPRKDVLILTQQADIVLVVTAEMHSDLLLGKFAEAISFGVPILGVSYKNSVTDIVLSEYGTPCAYQNIKGDVYSKLLSLIQNINSPSWLSNFYNNRETVMMKFSEEQILESTNAVSTFAANRFNAIQQGTVIPKPPQINNWP